MDARSDIQALFLDVGGVLLTNAWDDQALQRAARAFDLDLVELRNRHAATHETYELGKISLDDYLRHVVFHTPRPFASQDFAAFMRDQSQPLPGMIELFTGLKSAFDLKVAIVSNEGRELMDYRAAEFRLTSLADIFIVSCSLHVRKPDPEFYRAAIDICRIPPPQILYVDNCELLVEAGRAAGLRGVQHTTLEATRAALAAFGLVA